MIKLILALVLWISSAQYGTYAAHGLDHQYYHWNNDAWCSGHGPQTISVVNNDNWSVTSSQVFSTDCWVQTYPHIGWWGGDHISHYPFLDVSTSESGPSNSYQWEAAFDIWLNSSPGADAGYEVMIWTDTHNVSPCCLVGPVTIDKVRYNFYQGPGGNGPASWFVRIGNVKSSTVNIKDFLTYVGAHGGPRNPVVDTVEYGWEIWGTDGRPANFHMSEFHLWA